MMIWEDGRGGTEMSEDSEEGARAGVTESGSGDVIGWCRDVEKFQVTCWTRKEV